MNTDKVNEIIELVYELCKKYKSYLNYGGYSHCSPYNSQVYKIDGAILNIYQKLELINENGYPYSKKISVQCYKTFWKKYFINDKNLVFTLFMFHFYATSNEYTRAIPDEYFYVKNLFLHCLIGDYKNDYICTNANHAWSGTLSCKYPMDTLCYMQAVNSITPINISKKSKELHLNYITFYNSLTSYSLYEQFKDTKVMQELNEKIVNIINIHLGIPTYLFQFDLELLEKELKESFNPNLSFFIPRYIKIFYNLVTFDVFDMLQMIDHENKDKVLQQYYIEINDGNDFIGQIHELTNLSFDSPLIKRMKYYIDHDIDIIEEHFKNMIDSDNYNESRKHFENCTKKLI